MELVTIVEAAQLSGRSIQTIRRMIKRRQIKVKRQKTPQGFNYLIVKKSLSRLPDLDSQTTTHTDTQTTTQSGNQNILGSQATTREHKGISPDFESVFRREVGNFNSTIQKLIDLHDRDKTNFFQLIKTFQDRVVSLEDQIKMLEGPKPRWWQFWK